MRTRSLEEFQTQPKLTAKVKSLVDKHRDDPFAVQMKTESAESGVTKVFSSPTLLLIYTMTGIRTYSLSVTTAVSVYTQIID